MSLPEDDAAPPARRLFLALWPDDQVRHRLARLRDEVAVRHRGKAVTTQNLHITLVFLGSTDGTRRRCAEQAARRATAPPFTLVLDELGYFSRAGVCWIGSRDTPPALTELLTALRHGLAGCGFAIDERPYTPHVTLLRKFYSRPRLDAQLQSPVIWTVTGFHMVESVTLPRGVEYRIIDSWPLGVQ